VSEGKVGQMSRNSRRGSLSLAGVFLGAFLFPVFLAWILAPFVFSSHEQGDLSPVVLSEPAVILHVKTPSGFVSIPTKYVSSEQQELHSASPLHPQPGEDFLVWGWFRMLRLPPVGEKTLLLQRYDGLGVGPHPGYALALAREVDGIRPMVYWHGDEDDQGRWFSFAQVPLDAKEWFLISFTFHDPERVLELTISTSDGLRRAGAYDLEGQWLPVSEAPLVVGAVGDRDFRGKVGPFGVLSGSISPKQVRRIHLELSRDAESVPGFLEKEDISPFLWVGSEGLDRSQFQRKVVFSGKQKRKTKKPREGAGK